VAHSDDVVVASELLENKLHSGNVVDDVRTGLADALDDAAEHGSLGCDVDELIFDGGRTGVDNEDLGHANVLAGEGEWDKNGKRLI
jgi:hypothetical protein